ncbi:MAG TPA: hypothetical protein VNU19_00410 [Candidatus Acidoferrum sp.]|nr:hypothetical protein [Candidatus Acidoferrum sp.]
MKRHSVAITLFAVVVVACGQPSVASQSPTTTVTNPTPSAAPTMSPADAAELAKLEARPLRQPLLRSGQACYKDTLDPSTNLWGGGPVYLMGGPGKATSWGDFFDVSGITKPGLTGPVLMRARDIKAPNHPVVYVGPYATGLVYATDPSLGKVYVDLVLDVAHPTGATYRINGTNYDLWQWRQGIAKGWTGCISFQVDGPSFTEVVPVNVTPTP